MSLPSFSSGNCWLERSGVNILKEPLCRKLPFTTTSENRVAIDFSELKNSGFLKPQIPDAESKEEIIKLIQEISRKRITENEIQFLGKFWLPKSLKTNFCSWTVFSSEDDLKSVFVLKNKNNECYFLESIPCEFCGWMLDNIHVSDGWVCDRCYDEKMCVSESDDDDPYRRRRVYYKDAKRANF